MNLVDSLIELRILLANRCDGFNDGGKDAMLTNKLKVLFLLSVEDCSPNMIIDALCIAKSNVTNLLKTMMQEGLVEKYKSLYNSKNIYYSITDKGKGDLKKYKDRMESQVKYNCDNQVELSNNIAAIINILKGKKND